MKHSSVIALTALSLLLSACGGGGGSSDTAPPPVVVDNPDVTMALVEPQAYELNGQFAKFKIDRSGASGALSINYSLGGSTDITKGSASADDFQMVYSDGGDVGDRFAACS